MGFTNLVNLTQQYQQTYLVYCYKVMQYLQVLAWLTEQQEAQNQANIDQVKQKSASGIKKLAPNPNQEKLNFKSLKHLEKLDVSTIVASGQTKGIINMGGRIYDAALGRVLQADPFVQDPTNTQSFNRYTYVFNNPLSYTDPSGYAGKGFLAFGFGAILTFVLGPLGSGVANIYWAAFFGGVASGFILTGNLRGALTAGFTAMATAVLFNKVGNFIKANNAAAKAGTNAAAGATGDVVGATAASSANPTAGVTTANSASTSSISSAGTSNSIGAASDIGNTIAGEAVDKVALSPVTVTSGMTVGERIFFNSDALLTGLITGTITSLDTLAASSEFANHDIDNIFGDNPDIQLDNKVADLLEKKALRYHAHSLWYATTQEQILLGMLDVVLLPETIGGVILAKGAALAGFKRWTIRRALQNARRVGRIGEESVRAVHNIGGRTSFEGLKQTRISDGFLPNVSITEIKNVANQSLTLQLRDYISFAKANNLRFDLFVRSTTKLTGPLLKEVANKNIILKIIPGT